MRNIILLIISISCFSSIYSQKSDNLIQFSGNTLISYGDSIEPVAFVTIRNKSRRSAAYSGPDGFFSLVVKSGDTVEFTAIGFKKSVLIIPKEIYKSKFFATQAMIRDTNQLREVTIVPWKNVDELKRAVLDLSINEHDLIIAYQNMQYERWATLRENMAPDLQENRSAYLAQHNSDNLRISTGLMPMNNLANPFAWMQFFDMISKKKKKKSNTEVNKYY